jgi:HEAT repeat protein
MIDKNNMIGLVEKYDSFLTDAAVAVLRLIDESNVKIERNLIDFLKGKRFTVKVETLLEYIDKLSAENVREKVVEGLWELHSAFLDLVVLIGSESSRQTAYLPLIKMMEKEHHHQRAFALATLCSFDFPEAVNSLARTFPHLNSEMRWVTLVLLKKRWDDKFIPIYLKALDDTDPEVVRIAVIALSQATAVSALGQIKNLLYHGSETVVITAINALVELGDKDASGQLLELFHKRDNPRIKATVVSAFGEIESEEAVDFLESVLEHRDSRVRANAVLALKNRNEKFAPLPEIVVNKIKKHMQDSDHRVRADSIQALWSMGLAENQQEIEKMLISDNEKARAAGAYLCGKLKLVQMSRQLEDLTADRSWSVRKMAALALLGLGDAGRSILDHLIDRGSSDQKIIATYAVGLSNDPDTIDQLIAQSRSGREMADLATSVLLKQSNKS